MSRRKEGCEGRPFRARPRAGHLPGAGPLPADAGAVAHPVGGGHASLLSPPLGRVSSSPRGPGPGPGQRSGHSMLLLAAAGPGAGDGCLPEAAHSPLCQPRAPASATPSDTQRTAHCAGASACLPAAPATAAGRHGNPSGHGNRDTGPRGRGLSSGNQAHGCAPRQAAPAPGHATWPRGDGGRGTDSADIAMHPSFHVARAPRRHQAPTGTRPATPLGPLTPAQDLPPVPVKLLFWEDVQ